MAYVDETSLGGKCLADFVEIETGLSGYWSGTGGVVLSVMVCHNCTSFCACAQLPVAIITQELIKHTGCLI
jgi:hypothetical protein